MHPLQDNKKLSSRFAKNYRDHGSYQIIERPLKSVFRITNTPRYQIFRYRTPEVKAMSVIDCDYLPADKVVFPPELALLIVRKAAAMATGS